MLPQQATGEGRPPAPERRLSVGEEITRRPRQECPGCGDDSPGGELCGGCQERPACEGRCGRVVRGGGMCESCRLDAHHAAIEAAATGDGACSGYGGRPCGRPVQTLGLCGKCRIEAEAARAASDTDWQAAVARAMAEVEAEQEQAAPF